MNGFLLFLKETSVMSRGHAPPVIPVSFARALTRPRVMASVLFLNDKRKANADVLGLAQTKEQRELIKWIYALRMFFGPFFGGRVIALDLARKCDHHDARFLVALFVGSTPFAVEDAKAVFLASSDARCRFWASLCDMDDRDEAILQWVLPQATARQAAFLGFEEAQTQYAMSLKRGTVEQFVWLRRSASQGLDCSRTAVSLLSGVVKQQVHLFDSGGFGRIMFELGGAFVHAKVRKEDKEVAWRAKDVYNRTCAEAKRTVLFWMWASKQTPLCKNMRRIIGEMAWDGKSAWIENIADQCRLDPTTLRQPHYW